MMMTSVAVLTDSGPVYVGPGIAFETVDLANSWFADLEPDMRELATFISESLFNTYDGDWTNDTTGRAELPNRWYRDVVQIYTRNND